MKAIVQKRYGTIDDLVLRDADMPQVGRGEVRIRVRAASVHPDIWHMATGLPYALRLMGAGLLRPSNPIPGTDMAGVVESVGDDVMHFRPGDEVFGETVRSHQWTNGGAFAEYVTVPSDALAKKPANLDFEQAAALPTAGMIALFNLREHGELRHGQSVLVNGAGGGVGSLAVQIAKAGGAHVTGVDSTKKMDLVRALGADRAMDFTREDFTRNGERYDLILDIPGNHSFFECRRVLTQRGKYVFIAHERYGAAGRRVLGPLPRAFGLTALAAFTRQLPSLKASFAMPNRADSLATLRELAEAGKLAPVIDKVLPLGEVTAALRYMIQGEPCGRVVLSV